MTIKQGIDILNIHENSDKHSVKYSCHQYSCIYPSLPYCRCHGELTDCDYKMEVGAIGGEADDLRKPCNLQSGMTCTESSNGYDNHNSTHDNTNRRAFSIESCTSWNELFAPDSPPVSPHTGGGAHDRSFHVDGTTANFDYNGSNSHNYKAVNYDKPGNINQTHRTEKSSSMLSQTGSSHSEFQNAELKNTAKSDSGSWLDRLKKLGQSHTSSLHSSSMGFANDERLYPNLNNSDLRTADEVEHNQQSKSDLSHTTPLLRIPLNKSPASFPGVTTSPYKSLFYVDPHYKKSFSSPETSARMRSVTVKDQEKLYRSRTNSGSLDNVVSVGTRSELRNDLDQLYEQSEKVKSKIMSVWNNMKYGWTLKTKVHFKYDSPVYLLGRHYHIKKTDEDDDELLDFSIDLSQPSTVELFRRDFTSRVWFTYRREFPQLPNSVLTTDCGWGCMLRCAQMLLAQAFLDHFLKRDWRLFDAQTKENATYHRQIIRWFGDYPSDQSPFSVHCMVQQGEKIGKGPGDWYGPASAVHILRDSMLRAYEYQPILQNIAIYVSQDCTVYKQDVLELCSKRSRTITLMCSDSDTDYNVATQSSNTQEQQPPPRVQSKSQNSNTEWKSALVILIPVRLGGSTLNPVYISCVKSLLAQENCIGIIGGKPKHSLYFVGWQDESVIYLDPHYCQDVVDTRERNFKIEEINGLAIQGSININMSKCGWSLARGGRGIAKTGKSFHCMSPRKMLISKMDPSCTIGFYCRTQEEFKCFERQTTEMVTDSNIKGMYPLFTFSDGRSSEINVDNFSQGADRVLRIRHTTNRGRNRSTTKDAEDFVFL